MRPCDNYPFHAAILPKHSIHIIAHLHFQNFISKIIKSWINMYQFSLEFIHIL